MIPIIICEDNAEQRKNVETIVYNHIVMEEYPMKIVLSTDNPDEVMAYLEEYPNQNGLYFLDVNLNHEINGILLASHIRESDIHAKIAFVTSHIELLPLTFKYKVEALDYIAKDGSSYFTDSVKSCIDIVHERFTADKPSSTGCYQVKDGSITRLIPFEDIIFFTTGSAPHKLNMHLHKSHISFYGYIKNMDEIAPNFFRTHKSFVVNLQNIKHINRKEKTIEMVNGETALLATKKMSALLNAIAEQGYSLSPDANL